MAKKSLTLDGSEESWEIQQNDPNWAVEPIHFEDVSHFVQLAHLDGRSFSTHLKKYAQSSNWSEWNPKVWIENQKVFETTT